MQSLHHSKTNLYDKDDKVGLEKHTTHNCTIEMQQIAFIIPLFHNYKSRFSAQKPTKTRE